MSTVKQLAEEIESGLQAMHPGLRKTVLRKLPLAVAAVLEVQTPNTVEIANKLPLETERSDMREQWLRRLLSNKLVDSEVILAPLAQSMLQQASSNGQVIELSMDQTDIGNRFAILMISVRMGDRALPLCWSAQSGAANLGFAHQQVLLERVAAWLPASAAALLCADRFYPSAKLFDWLQQRGWHYRLRLKGNILADIGSGEITTTGELAQGQQARYERNVLLFESAVMTNLGILHESGHAEAWIIAMDCPPTRATVLDYSSRWGIEPMFSDFKSRGFGLEQTQLEDPQRLERLILIMALAMYWCVTVGKHDAFTNPTPTEKKPKHKPTLTTGLFAKPPARCSPGLNAGYAYCYDGLNVARKYPSFV